MAQTLLNLAALITDAAHKIDATCKSKGATWPELSEPVKPEAEGIRNEQAVIDATAILAAAAEQILAASWTPARYVFDASFGFHTSSAIRVASAVNVAEFLREAGPKGAHVKDIVAGTVVVPEKLSRLLRLLASRHIFKEVEPDVFANNLMSSLLDTGKSSAELRANPAQKFDNTSGLLALMDCTVDEYFKASGYLTEALTTPEIAKSDRPNDSAMCLAHGIKDPDDYWTWLEKPAQAYNLRRFGVAMQGARQMAPEHYILQGFGWKDLPAGSVVVDVGGGTGHVSMLLAKAHPQLKLVVQDRHQTIAHGREFWQTTWPEAVQTGRVELQGHDFFDPQPPRAPPALYLLRFIVHDWADSYAAKILRRLREAAAPTTKLMLIERIIPYACKANDAEYRKGIPGTEDDSSVPEPLLENLGVVNLNGYLADIQMLTAFNGQERTLQEFDRLYAASGWKLVQVHKTEGLASQIIGIPA